MSEGRNMLTPEEMVVKLIKRIEMLEWRVSKLEGKDPYENRVEK